MLEQIIAIARAYASLGDAIGEQLQATLVDSGRHHRPTPGACDYISDRLIPELRRLSEYIADEDTRGAYETEIDELSMLLSPDDTIE